MKVPARFARRQGFTLIELLVVIAIIAILSVVVFVALDPVRRFQDARDARRFADVNSILTATHEYIVDNDGALPPDFEALEVDTIVELSDTASGQTAACTTAGATGSIDLAGPLAAYLKSMPIDPLNTASNAGTYQSGYVVSKDANNLITVSSCAAENNTVEVSR